MWNSSLLCNCHYSIWASIIASLLANKLIALTKKDLFFTYNKKLKLEWCASFVITKAQKTLRRVSQSENTCWVRDTHLWKLKMGMKNMKTFMISLSYSMKKLKSKNCTQTHWELITKKLRLLLTKRIQKNQRKRCKRKRLKWRNKIKIGMMLIVKKTKNGKTNLMKKMEQLNKMKMKIQMMKVKWNKSRREK